MAVLVWLQNTCAIFSNISDFAIYVHVCTCTVARYMPSCRLQRLDKPLILSKSDV